VSADSKTKFVLETKWGNNGYAFWFKLLELLGRSEGHYYDYSTLANRTYLIALMKLDESTVGEILDTLADLGKIDPELWVERKVIWCQRLVDNLQQVYAKRTVQIPNKPFSEPPKEPEQPEQPAQKAQPKKEAAPAEQKAESAPKKRGRPKKAEAEKKRYAEFVHMTEEEYQKLIETYGEEKTKRAVEVLDNYKGSKGKTYKSDYRAILSWAMDRVNEEFGKRGGGSYGGAYPDRGYNQQPAGNPGGFKPSGGFKGQG
jgi:hypothetical protein